MEGIRSPDNGEAIAMKIVLLGLMLCFCMPPAHAKTSEQTASWLGKRFPSIVTGSRSDSFAFSGCSISFKLVNDALKIDRNVELDGQHAKGVRVIKAFSHSYSPGQEIYSIFFSQKAVSNAYSSDYRVEMIDRFNFHRKATSPDMPDRILKALSHLITQCTGSPPESVVNEIAKDDLF